MTGFSGNAFLHALPWTAGTVLVIILITFGFAQVTGRNNQVDTAWGLMFVGAGAAAFLASSGDGDDVRRVLLLAMVAIWGLRLAWHVGRRSIGKGEDPRYAELLHKGHANPTVNAVVKIFAPQALLAFVISAPLQVGAFEFGSVGVVGGIGVVVWAVGVFFETVGDAQMERYKAWKRAQPKDEVEASVMDRGLWRYTRHPNYFGDAAVWTGIFLVAAERWPGVLTLPALAIMIFLLTAGSGKKNLERSMVKRPGYREYMQRTSGFFPLPPRKQPPGPNSRPPGGGVSLTRG